MRENRYCQNYIFHKFDDLTGFLDVQSLAMSSSTRVVMDLLKELDENGDESSYYSLDIGSSGDFRIMTLKKNGSRGGVQFHHNPSHIFTPPGWRLNQFAAFFFSKKTYEHVLQPAIDDLQKEYIEAISEQRIWKSRWVWVRGYWAFWKTVFLQIPVSTVRLILRIWTTAG